METLYRRPLPAHAIAFSSADGRQLFAEALADGGMTGYFPLAEQFHTQADPMFCGLGSLVVALNALAIDPGRLWKGPWRWFAEDLLDCCVALEEVRRRGLDLDELACLARCNGADVGLHRGSLDELRAALAASASGEAVMIAAYDRGVLEQTGTGHFSPVGGYHAARDLALVLDVARFKYPPHWVSVERLWQAMQPTDPANGKPRGWLLLRRRSGGLALGYSLACEGDSLQGLADRVAAIAETATEATTLDELAHALGGIASHVVVRAPINAAHESALDATRTALRSLAAYTRIAELVGPARADAVALLLLAVAERLPAGRRAEIMTLVDEARAAPTLAAELATLQAQLAALWSFRSTRPR